MSKENLNNIPNWKLKLDALDSLPGDPEYDKNRSWEKLYVRLGGKKKSINKTWFWVAAACIFFAVLVPLFYADSNNQHSTGPALNEHQASIKTHSPIIDKGDPAAVTNLTVTNNEREFPAASSETMTKMMHENKKTKLRLTYTVSLKSLTPEIKSNFITLADTLSSLATIQPEKKKLRVAHINELGDPVETLPEIVKNSDKHTFQFKIASQEIYINPATASNTNSFTILKIKPSQN
ncbi:MAG: hypothetical protein ABI184_01255 [Ginsengibacter sp.]